MNGKKSSKVASAAVWVTASMAVSLPFVALFWVGLVNRFSLWTLTVYHVCVLTSFLLSLMLWVVLQQFRIARLRRDLVNLSKAIDKTQNTDGPLLQLVNERLRKVAERVCAIEEKLRGGLPMPNHSHDDGFQRGKEESDIGQERVQPIIPILESPTQHPITPSSSVSREEIEKLFVGFCKRVGAVGTDELVNELLQAFAPCGKGVRILEVYRDMNVPESERYLDRTDGLAYPVQSVVVVDSNEHGFLLPAPVAGDYNFADTAAYDCNVAPALRQRDRVAVCVVAEVRQEGGGFCVSRRGSLRFGG